MAFHISKARRIYGSEPPYRFRVHFHRKFNFCLDFYWRFLYRNHGFFCTGCPKLFPRSTKPSHPTPRPSASTNNRRRKLPTALTKKALIKERAEKRRRTREQKKREGTLNADGIRIRGRWASTTTRRQDNGLGSAFDGSQGVDSEDILRIPNIDFSTFQLFPDQNSYAADDPNLSPFNNTLQGGTEWIQKQAQTAQLYGSSKSLVEMRGLLIYPIP
jgi:mannan endo-1,4-beta-mannosidase